MNDVEWVELGASGEQREAHEFERLLELSNPTPDRLECTPRVAFPVVGTFKGFSLDDAPLVVLPSVLPGEILTARSTVALTRNVIGSEVVVLCENGDPYCPIVMGVIEGRRRSEVAEPLSGSTVVADDERYVISAEREIVLRCGDSSITLTRAGKVIIKGNYILSRSTGYNKIKGAAVDIN